MYPEELQWSRREVLAAGSAGALALAGGVWPANSWAGLFRRSPANCICLFNSGGMSHIDLWDPKPTARAEVRGDFSAIETNVPGLFLSELLPRTAQIAHKLVIVRGMMHGESDHAPSRRLLAEGLDCKLKIENCKLEIGVGQDALLWNSEGPVDLERQCEDACRKIESGGRFVGIENSHWDTHSRNSWMLREVLAPAFDRAFSSLILGLDERGLLSSTLVVVATEFGRSPRINSRGGRDHWPHAFSIVLAGGEIIGGRTIGRTDRDGAEVLELGVPALAGRGL